MALFPCDFHLARYKGPSSAAYPALLRGSETQRRHVRSCGECLEARINEPAVPIQELLFNQPQDMALTGSRNCPHCHEPGTVAFFLAVYLRGSEEKQYYSPVCEEAAELLEEQWGLTDA